MIRTLLALACLSSPLQADGLRLLSTHAGPATTPVAASVPVVAERAPEVAPKASGVESRVRAALRCIEPAVRHRHSEIVETGYGLRVDIGGSQRPLLGIWARF
ncbi:MAG: hypothetical protein ACU0CI_04590 [Shimia sp.]